MAKRNKQQAQVVNKNADAEFAEEPGQQQQHENEKQSFKKQTNNNQR